MLQKLKLLTVEEYNNFGGNYGKFETSTGDTSETTFDNIQASILDRIDSFFRGRLTKLTEVIVDEEPTWIDNLSDRLLPNDLNRIKKAIYYELEDISVFDKYTLGSEGGTAQGSGVNYTPSQKAIIAIRDELSHTAIAELKKTELWKDLKTTLRTVTGVNVPGTWRIDAQFSDAVRLSALAYGVTIVDNTDGTVEYIATEYKGDAVALMDSINENWDLITELIAVANPEEIQRQLDEMRAEINAIQAQDVERKLLNKKDFNASTVISTTTPHTMIFEDEERDYIKSVGSKIFMNPRFVEDQVQNTIQCSASNATTIQKWVKLTYYADDGTEKNAEFQDEASITYEPVDANVPTGVGEYNNIHSIPRISFVNAIVANGGDASYEFTTNDYYEIEFRTQNGEATLLDVSLRANNNNISRVVEQIESFVAGKLFVGQSNQDNNVYVTATLPANLATGEGIITVSIPPDVNGNSNLLFNTNVNLSTYLPVRANVNYIQPIGQNDPNEYIRTQEVKEKVIRIKYDPVNSHYVCINYSEPTFIHTLRISEPSSNMGLGRVYKQQELQFLFMNSAINSYQPDLGNSFSLVARILNGECIERLQDTNGDNYWVVAGTFEVFSMSLGEEQIVTGKLHIYDDNRMEGYFWGEQAGGGSAEPIIWDAGTTHSYTELPKGIYYVYTDAVTTVSNSSSSITNGTGHYISNDYYGSPFSSTNNSFLYIDEPNWTQNIFTNSNAQYFSKIMVSEEICTSHSIKIDRSPISSDGSDNRGQWLRSLNVTISTFKNVVFVPVWNITDTTLLVNALKKMNLKEKATTTNAKNAIQLTTKEQKVYDTLLVKQKEYEDKRKNT